MLSFSDNDGKAKRLPIKRDESVLSALLTSGYDVPYGCQAGSCQNCKMQCLEPNKLPAKSQQGLSTSLIEQGYFLACTCFPKKSLTLKLPEVDTRPVNTRVMSKDFLSEDVLRLRVETPFSFSAGQFCNLYTPEEIRRSYSIANTPSDDFLEFHIRIVKNGGFSTWAAKTLKEDDTLAIQGPFGDCTYSLQFTYKPLFLSGIGTGLAPLVGIIKTAIEKNHSAEIHLLYGAKSASGFYLNEELQALEDHHANLHVHWLCADNTDLDAESFMQHANIYEYAKQHFAHLDDYGVYLCGAPSFVQKMKKQCYLSGASMQAIFSDAFTPAITPKEETS